MKKLTLLIALSMISLSAFTQTLSFPSSAPEFKITFPSGWKMETEDGVLSVFPKDQSIYIGLWEIADAANFEVVMDVLGEELDKVITVYETDEAEEITLNRLSMIAIDRKGIEKNVRRDV